MLQVLLPALTLSVMIFALVSIITADSGRVRFLPKFGWVVLVVLIPLVGSLLWYGLGKERADRQDTPSFDNPRRYTAHRMRPTTVEADMAAIGRDLQFHEREMEIRRLEDHLRGKRRRAIEGQNVLGDQVGGSSGTR